MKLILTRTQEPLAGRCRSTKLRRSITTVLLWGRSLPLLAPPSFY
jgi:hypothetical protein